MDILPPDQHTDKIPIYTLQQLSCYIIANTGPRKKPALFNNTFFVADIAVAITEHCVAVTQPSIPPG